MLKNIHPALGPDLLHALATMGHGDELVIADAHFPAATTARRLVRADGVGGETLLEAILSVLPLDTFVPVAVHRMEVVGDPGHVPPICDAYARIVERLAGPFRIGTIERFAFYERSRRAAYVVASGEQATYACLILTKGVVATDL